jgi:AraC family transcriptional regulator
MDTSIERAVERAIVTMHDNLGEPLTIDDMARAAMFSKFHFTRIFQRVTGVSPGRFLSAMRLQRAKQLLVSTSMNVADISVLVGYNSVGTFSSRFSRSVGLSPTAYRRLKGYTADIPTADARNGADPPSAVVRGTIWPFRPDWPGLVFVGLFADRIPEGRPVCCTVLSRPGPYRFEGVPLGSWYLLAQSAAADTEDLTTSTFAADQSLTVGTHGPIMILRDTNEMLIDLWLNPMRSVDPPVLLALLDARKLALTMRDRQIGRADALPAAELVGGTVHELRSMADAGRTAA